MAYCFVTLVPFLFSKKKLFHIFCGSIFHFFLFEKIKCNKIVFQCVCVCICMTSLAILNGCGGFYSYFFVFIHLSWLRMILNYIFTIKIANIFILECRLYHTTLVVVFIVTSINLCYTFNIWVGWFFFFKQNKDIIGQLRQIDFSHIDFHPIL